MPISIDLNTFANGALKERVNEELQKILENIEDPNTDAKKKRKLTVILTLAADESRDVIITNVAAKTTLAPAKNIEAKILMDLDNQGNVTGAELKSGIKGQTYLDTDTGEVLDDQGSKIINFKN
jgi:tRNA uridine 5-carbamoylmethylation protein Kti12